MCIRDRDTIYIDDNGTQQGTFSRAPRQFWSTKRSGVSDNAVTVSETQGVGQVGATLGSICLLYTSPVEEKK